MKRFHILLAVLMLGIGGVAVAAMPSEKKAVKIEVSSPDQAVSPALISAEFDLNYVAEATGESIIEERPPTVIGKISDAYETSIIKPPIASNRTFLPDIRRLSCNSLAAASGRHD